METTDKTKVMRLPIFQHLDSNSLVTQGKNALDKFRKGEMGIFRGMKITSVALLGVGGYLTWVYVLPMVFMAVGAMLATAAVGILAVAGVFLAPVFIKGMRRLTRKMHKGIIGYDPFGELEDQRQTMLKNLSITKESKAQIKLLKNDMENESHVSEKKARELEKSILMNEGKAKVLKAEIEDMKKNGGQAALGTDEYVEKNTQLMDVVSQANRDGNMLEQMQNFVRKYATRANVMQKVDQKLAIATTVAQIKIKDFEATIEILKKDSEFASKTRVATDAAKSAIGFSTGWELDYALDVVTNTIANDIAATSVNLSDISSLTSQFDLNSDEMYARLDLLANDIKIGNNVTPDASQYQNPNYKFTAEDKVQAEGFGNIF